MNKPKVGDLIMVHNIPATVRKLLPFGTIEVETEDGNWFRLSGFPLA